MTTKPTEASSAEEIEGYDQGLNELGAFPIDSFMIRNEIRSVYEIARRIDSGQYFMAPDFQRDFVWDTARQSKLIESAILRIPLPVFYLAETLDGKIVVVDGLQRLTTFHKFVKNEIALRDLEYLPSLNGKKFKDLEAALQNRIEDTPLTLYLIDSQVPDGVKYEIFERVNGGVPLTRQQMRNCLYNGDATHWLTSASKDKSFLKATGNSLNSKTMRDRESINRFAGFFLYGLSRYQGNMDKFLNEALRRMNEEKPDLEELTEKFVNSMNVNYALFGIHSFRKSLISGGGRSVINISLFDVLSCIFADWPIQHAKENKNEIKQIIVDLLQDDDYAYSITYSTNSTRNVESRFKRMKEALAPLKP